MKTWFASLSGRSLAFRSVLLGLVVLGLYVLLAPLSAFWSGLAGLLTAAVAGALCMAGALPALAASHLLRKPKYALHGLLLGTLLRMGVPLTLGLILHFRGGVLAQAGLLYYLLVFYPVTLGVETALSLPRTQPKGHSPVVPRNPAF